MGVNAVTNRLKWMIPMLTLSFLVSSCGLVDLLKGGEGMASELTYPIVDTNQSKTYDNGREIPPPMAGEPFYGQDEQHTGNSPRYLDNGDATVTDLVTGLMWQQAVGPKVTYAEAVAGAKTFNLAGYSDWRLPSIKELYSLIDFSGLDVSPESSSGSTPFIDTDYFQFEYGDIAAGERIIDSQWATSTLYVASSFVMFGVNFADGRIKGYPIHVGKLYFVRYVRGNPAYGENAFVDNGDGTISDLATGLMWAKDDSGVGMNWQAALVYVQTLNAQGYLGYSDWRLPNAKELQSIVDYTRSPDTTGSAAIDPLFNSTSITNEAGGRDWAYYWTSTTHASERGGETAVYIAFGRGLGYMGGRWTDIHGAGCQRSDPKTGAPSAYPMGRGPQGDAIRILNVVRVVRGGS